MAGIRLGVFGGTFNPIHLGHIHVARSVQQLFDLSRIYFVVATTPPHKPGIDLAPFVHRYAMVSLAAACSSRFVPSTAELESPASPFSIDTMNKFASRCGNAAGLYFIAGGDSLLEVEGWHRGEQLLGEYNFVFVLRPGTPLGDPRDILPRCYASRVRDFRGMGRRKTQEQLRLEQSARSRRIFVVDVDAPDISASRIRQLAASGRRFASLLPVAVVQYIRKLRLYGER